MKYAHVNISIYILFFQSLLPPQKTTPRFEIQNAVYLLELVVGLEPTTCALRMRCSTN